MREMIVEMGGLELGHENDTLISLGLGSCVAAIIYDPHLKIASLAHIMLPDSRESTINSPEKKALVAEKDTLIRKQIKDILTGQEFNVIGEAGEKEETMIEYRKIKPTISFISAFLPPTNGIDVIHSIMSIDHNADAIVLSPSTDANTLLNYISNGAKEVMLAPFTEIKVKSCIDYIMHKNMLKFADRAVPIMVGRLLNRGANKNSLIAKIVGGAHMFPTLMDEEVMNIGKRNVEAVKKQLQALGIKIVAEETGASIGRTAIFSVGTGMLKIKTKNGIKEI